MLFLNDKKIIPSTGTEYILIIALHYKVDICMTTLYVTESGSFIKRKDGHVIVGRYHEVLFEAPFESINDVTGCYWNGEGRKLF